MPKRETGLRTGDAATLLGIEATTLRSWQRRYDWPPSQRSAGGHRSFDLLDIESLAMALRSGLTGGSAIAHAREASDIYKSSFRLAGVLENFDKSGANRLMEKAMSIQSTESAISKILLPSARQIGEAGKYQTAAWSFTGKWACDWMSRAANFLPEARRGSIVVGNANNGEMNQDTLEISAFEVFAKRLGFEVIDLAVEHNEQIGSAVTEINPVNVVLAGNASAAEQTGRWTYYAQSADHPVSHRFRHVVTNTSLTALPDDPYLASQELA
jgi:DNA-binding transcriptional MerR regulator